MTDRQKLHFLLAVIANLIVVGLLINRAWEGNDKAILLVIIFYPLLTIINGIIWGVLAVIRRPESKIYRLTTLGLLILYLPAIFVSAMY